MKIKIPYRLKEKFLGMDGLEGNTESHEIVGFGGKVTRIPGHTKWELKLDLSDDLELLECCIEWHRIIRTYFQTSYNKGRYKLDIGAYQGLWPFSIVDGIVEFSVDMVDPNNETWRDWFIQEDFEYAPK